MLGVLLGSITVLTMALIGAGWLIRRPWPKVQGSVTLPGLKQPVEILRDHAGIPHIFASDEHDLCFAQGYAHAQDRLWQMELNRRLASGTLSAILGPTSLESDRFMRTLRFRQAAEQEWEQLSEELRAYLTAYANGVNAYVKAHRRRLPLEMRLLKVTPEPWHPVDSLLWGKLLSYNLGDNASYELLRARLIKAIGHQRTKLLFPAFAPDTPDVLAEPMGGVGGLGTHHPDEPTVLTNLIGKRTPEWGSNAWVIHGSRTASGMPLLANDTHLGLGLPSIWYENGLHGGRIESVGFTIPGVPLIIMGRNKHIGWGITNSRVDVQDLYVERVDSATDSRYHEFEGEWRPIQVLEETIEVKGRQSVSLPIRLTQHGPLINDVVKDLASAEKVSFRWMLHEDSRLFSAIVNLNLATDWASFRHSLRDWRLPSLNFVYADVAGNIGYQLAGAIPARTKAQQGFAPAPGWDGSHEWNGAIPFEELPFALNPASGFIVSANNNISFRSPHSLGADWDPGYRARRISDLITSHSRMTSTLMRDIQLDTLVLPAIQLVPHLLGVHASSPLQERALEFIRTWDYCAKADSIGATIYEVWYWFLLQGALKQVLEASLLERYIGMAGSHVQLMIDLMKAGGTGYLQIGGLPATVMSQEAFESAIGWLRKHYGADPLRWQWGTLHTMSFVAAPFGRINNKLLRRVFNSAPIPAAGNKHTVNSASFALSDTRAPFVMRSGVAQRIILDLSSPDASMAINSTGQSGHFAHPQQKDMIKDWQRGDYHPLFLSKQSIQQDLQAKLLLQPAC